jgi:hypothetical protein
VPQQYGAARTGLHRGGCVAAVDDAELVLVVADSELDIGGVFLIGPLEVRLDAEQLRVPVARRGHVVGPEVHRGHAT